MSSVPPGDRHRIDGGRRHRAEPHRDHADEDGLAYAGETLDAGSPQVEIHMSNPPTAQASGSDTEATDGGTEGERSSTGDDRGDGDADDDPSSSGSSPNNVTTSEEQASVFFPSRPVDDTPADGREMTREDGSSDPPAERRDESGRVDDEFRRDDDSSDDDVERDGWGRCKVGLDWPLPPESRLPMDS